jgi:hypothetical protein
MSPSKLRLVLSDWPSGTDKHRYMIGPNQFCQGYGPESGDVCTNIPANCYIVVLIDNTSPQVHCPL